MLKLTDLIEVRRRILDKYVLFACRKFIRYATNLTTLLKTNWQIFVFCIKTKVGKYWDSVQRLTGKYWDSV